MRFSTSIILVILTLASVLDFSHAKKKHVATHKSTVIDSLKKRPLADPATLDPSVYQDDATFGTFKANLPPPDVPDSLYTPNLKNGFRIQFATVSTEDSARKLLESVARKYQTTVSLRWSDGKYELLAGNYSDANSADQLLAKLQLGGYHVTLVPSRVVVPSRPK